MIVNASILVGDECSYFLASYAYILSAVSYSENDVCGYVASAMGFQDESWWPCTSKARVSQHCWR